MTKIKNEYEEFLNHSAGPSKELSDKVLCRINQLLNPSGFLVFAKIMGIHFIIGFLSLAVCHQFNLNPFNTRKSLADLFMNIGGYQVCMLLCGVTFISLSIISASFFLSIEEVIAFRKREYLQSLAMGLISLGFLFLFGADVALGIGALWLIGAVIGGVGATETIWRLKSA